MDPLETQNSMLGRIECLLHEMQKVRHFARPLAVLAELYFHRLQKSHEVAKVQTKHNVSVVLKYGETFNGLYTTSNDSCCDDKIF